jgi:predicted ester cyclase
LAGADGGGVDQRQRTAFPDGVMKLDAVYSADDRVATRFRFEGHAGPS